MSSITGDSLPLPGNDPKKPIKIKALHIFVLSYGIVPLVLLTLLIDRFYLNHALRDLPFPTGRELVKWTAIFDFPHVLASAFTMMEARYLRYYWRHLLVGIGSATALQYFLKFGTVQVVSMSVTSAYTVYHHGMQQFGISQMMQGQKHDLALRLWRYSGTLSFIVTVTLCIFAAGMNPENLRLSNFFVLLCTALALYFTFAISRRVTSRLGRCYLIGDALTLITGALLFKLGYYFLAAFMPRVIHSVTAYIIYMVHDANRHRAGGRNPVYVLSRWLGISPLILSPLISISLGVVLIQTFTFAAVIVVFWHFYMESVMWKNGTPHREAVAFTR